MESIMMKAYSVDKYDKDGRNESLKKNKAKDRRGEKQMGCCRQRAKL